VSVYRESELSTRPLLFLCEEQTRVAVGQVIGLFVLGGCLRAQRERAGTQSMRGSDARPRQGKTPHIYIYCAGK